MSHGGEEVLHLPVIVEAAESSPSAAAAAAQQIRKFLTRDYSSQPHVQYNAIMLIRILSDNPGPSFTRNFDKPFVSTIKEALRNCKDGSTQQILRETLDALEANKQFQEGMEGLIQMWRKEKGHQARLSHGYGVGAQAAPGFGSGAQNTYLSQNPTRSMGREERHQSGSRPRQLPPPIELASRIEEAKNTAKILLQLIQSTPSDEVLNNDLIREFADRCQSAQRSMQGYINCDAPPPDDDTMLTLIETNEQLSLASTRYQRSVLNARRALGVSPSPNTLDATNPASGPYAPPLMSPPAQNENLFASNPSPQQAVNSNAFGNSDESYQAPMGPPLPRRTGSGSPLDNRDESYAPPPGPPPSMLARLSSREGQSPTSLHSPGQPPRLPSLDQPSDPFADPVEHDRNAAPIAYAAPSSPTAQRPANRPHSQTFSIDTEPQYGPGNAREPSSAYSGRAAPILPSTTPSYLGRQASALNGLTMHGAQDDTVPEIDGHSEVGRTTGAEHRRTNSAGSDDPYSVSPVEVRTSQGPYRY
jgi:hypothetical protein